MSKELTYAGFSISLADCHIFRRCRTLHIRMRQTLETEKKMLINAIAALATVGLFFYLLYALVRPEKF
jgi:K+-transporting ATPase KdpF subunit